MAKQTSKKITKKSDKVDFEPNKMSLAIAALASVSLVSTGCYCNAIIIYR